MCGFFLVKILFLPIFIIFANCFWGRKTQLLRKRIPCFAWRLAWRGKLHEYFFFFVSSTSNLRLSSLFIYFLLYFILIWFVIFLNYNHSTLGSPVLRYVRSSLSDYFIFCMFFWRGFSYVVNWNWSAVQLRLLMLIFQI